ncbi:MAG: methyltransferase RsmF C-terminal domain-like protein [Blautia sp.]
MDEARAYLAGQTFPAEGEKGWYLITVDGYSLGWGKLAGSVMKNHYQGAAEAALIYKRNHINWKTYNIAVFAEIFGVYQIFL